MRTIIICATSLVLPSVNAQPTRTFAFGGSYGIQVIDISDRSQIGPHWVTQLFEINGLIPVGKRSMLGISLGGGEMGTRLTMSDDLFVQSYFSPSVLYRWYSHSEGQAWFFGGVRAQPGFLWWSEVNGVELKSDPYPMPDALYFCQELGLAVKVDQRSFGEVFFRYGLDLLGPRYLNSINPEPTSAWYFTMGLSIWFTNLKQFTWDGKPKIKGLPAEP